ncbi:sulfite exporter TauE/SafE family protein [Clostridium algidicarnis]|uniref:sulfite exporter TauE/SafE family protein n=1 Tax=Clostridium algidicarnis TaxID=37659 RepID=UPI003FD6CEE8
MIYISLPIVGFLIGVFIITLGGGGGAIYVGVLTAVFNIAPAIAASTSLATMVPTTAIGAYSHWKSGNIKVKLGIYMIVGGIIGSVIGAYSANLLPEFLYNKILGIFMLLLSFQMLMSFLKKKNENALENDEDTLAHLQSINIIKSFIYGILAGIMSGIAGLSGGGIIIVGLSVIGCSSLEIVGTSVFVIFGISTVGFLMHLSLGNINWSLILLLIPGTMIGAFIGPIVLKKMNKKMLEKYLKPLMLIITVAMGIMLTLKK